MQEERDEAYHPSSCIYRGGAVVNMAREVLKALEESERNLSTNRSMVVLAFLALLLKRL
jgi:hypothetical protein